MLYRIHFFPGLTLFSLGLALLVLILRLLGKQLARHPATLAAAGASAVLLVLGYLLEYDRVIRLFPVWWSTWLECAAMVEIVGLICVSVVLFFWRKVPPFQPSRFRAKGKRVTRHGC